MVQMNKKQINGHCLQMVGIVHVIHAQQHFWLGYVKGLAA